MRNAFLFVALFFSLLCSAFAETTYKFGVVPQFEPRRLSAIWTPILVELEKRTGFKLEMVGAANIPEFEKEFENGRFDFAYMNPYHATVAMRLQKYEPLVRDGERKLFGILVAAKDGSIETIADLAGKTVAFPAPNALGASLMIRADLERQHKINISPMWAQTHDSAYLNVAIGRAAAAGGVMGTYSRQPKEVQDKLKIIYETQRISPHPVMAHPRVPEHDREKLRQAFLDIGTTPQGAALLAKIPIKGVVPAKAEDYQEITDLGLEHYYINDGT